MASSRFNGPAKSSVIDVPRGLYVLRYKRSAASQPPLIYLQPAHEDQARYLTFLAHPDRPQTSLERPGEAIAIASDGSAQLQIIVEGRGRDASTDAHLDLEPLILGSDVGSTSETRSSGRAFSAAALSLLGHVSRRGDVIAPSGEWLAGPSAPSPIEGVELRLTGAPASWIEGQVLVSGERDWSPWRSAGMFLGTRGRARAIIGLRVRMNTAAPSENMLDGSALFLGSAVDRKEGRSLEFISPARRDPLIGLSLALKAKHQTATNEGATLIERAPEATRGRVRVFRDGTEI